MAVSWCEGRRLAQSSKILQHEDPGHMVATQPASVLPASQHVSTAVGQQFKAGKAVDETSALVAGLTHAHNDGRRCGKGGLEPRSHGLGVPHEALIGGSA